MSNQKKLPVFMYNKETVDIGMRMMAHSNAYQLLSQLPFEEFMVVDSNHERYTRVRGTGTQVILSPCIDGWSNGVHIYVELHEDMSYEARVQSPYNYPPVDNEVTDAFVSSIYAIICYVNNSETFYYTKEVSEKKRQARKQRAKSNSNFIKLELIKIRPEVLNSNTSGSPKRPHLRRGHFRRLNSGGRIWVKSCSIKGGEKGGDYELK